MIRFSKGYGFHYITISTTVSFCSRLTQQTCLTNFSDTHSQHHAGFNSFINTNFVTLLSNGRPYGGCAVYFRNTLSSSISHCQIVSRRFCGIKVKLAGGHIYLVVCVYLPFDDGHASDTLKFGEVLGELRLFCTLSIMICWLWLEILMVTLLVLIVDLELVNCFVPCRLLV